LPCSVSVRGLSCSESVRGEMCLPRGMWTLFHRDLPRVVWKLLHREAYFTWTNEPNKPKSNLNKKCRAC
jgi:hypothetical protein